MRELSLVRHFHVNREQMVQRGLWSVDWTVATLLIAVILSMSAVLTSLASLKIELDESWREFDIGAEQFQV